MKKHLQQIILIVCLVTLLFPVETFTQTKSKQKNTEADKTRFKTYWQNNSKVDKANSGNNFEVERRNKKDQFNNNDFTDNYKRRNGNKREKEKFTETETHRNYNRNEIYTENYFRIDRSGNTLWDGKHWKASSFPLSIYVKESGSRYYKSEYKNYVKYALDVWRKADDRINYRFVKSPDDADIAVIFVENLGDRYEENYLGLTNYETGRQNEIEFSKIEISLIKNGNEKVSAGEIKATIIHEFGHAFGLGHSDNQRDLMYPYISSNHTPDMNYSELSKGDKLAIKDAINLSFEEQYVFN
ncbi:MAG: matrixin family metalloprotease [Ignavibacteriaceae bacterium]|nr:matrixin family metalloprotease [Ignavibacteriaceae bacterium]